MFIYYMDLMVSAWSVRGQSHTLSAMCIYYSHNPLCRLVVLKAGLLLEFYIRVQHIRSYQDGYRLATMRTAGDFIVLSHWEIGNQATVTMP